MPNAVQYAENTLGVHTPWSEAQTRLASHDSYTTAEVGAAALIRLLKDQIADYEAEVVSQWRADEPSLSATAFKQYVKDRLGVDTNWRKLRDDLTAHEVARDAAEAGRRHEEQGLRVLSARMEELAGLLHFYAAAKTEQGAT